jgi:recombinational DNA repair ATPase RecF
VNPERRRWLARRLLEVKQGYLNEQRQERERLERKNRNLEEALAKVRAIEALRSQKRK